MAKQLTRSKTTLTYWPKGLKLKMPSASTLKELKKPKKKSENKTPDWNYQMWEPTVKNRMHKVEKTKLPQSISDLGIKHTINVLLEKNKGTSWDSVHPEITKMLAARYSQISLQKIHEEIAKIVLVPYLTIFGMAYREYEDPFSPVNKNLDSAVGRYYIHPINRILSKVQGRYADKHTENTEPVIRINANTWNVWNTGSNRWVRYTAKNKKVIYTSAKKQMLHGKIVSRGESKIKYVQHMPNVGLPGYIKYSQLKGFDSKTQFLYKLQAL